MSFIEETVTTKCFVDISLIIYLKLIFVLYTEEVQRSHRA